MSSSQSSTAPTAKINRYGLDWPSEAYDDLKIEMWFIRKGGSWVEPKSKRVHGNGLPFHYEAMRKLLWPHLDDHRWHRLCRDEILKNKCTVLMGCASSGKTHEASWLYLCEYFCFPDDTLVLVSSTDMRGLRLRVWGEIADLWQQALDKYPCLPGHLIDSRISITTDSLEDKEVDEARRVRDMRKGIAGVPTIQGNKTVGLGKWCFPAGQMVDTLIGKRPIETISEGEIIISAAGPSKVIATMSRCSKTLVKITLVDGRSIDCTPNHPILTTMGWVNASCLTKHHSVMSVHESMSCLREEIARRQEEKVLLKTVSMRVMEEGMSAMQSHICTERATGRVLLSELRCKMEDVPTLHRSENDRIKESCGGRRIYKRRDKEERKGDDEAERQRESLRKKRETRLEAIQLQISNSSRRNSFISFPRGNPQPESENWAFRQTQKASDVPHRRGVFENKTGGRNRWKESQTVYSKVERHRKRQVSIGTRVDCVTILESSGDSRYNASEGGYRVYDLQIDDHPSFSVNGIVVHNCGIKQKRVRLIGDELQLMGPSFLSSFSNLNNNADFRAVLLGNPVDITDQLGIASEPIDGWGTTQMEATKTSVWDTKFYGGRCVNLIGVDSPNFDAPGPAKYKYMISRDKIAETLSSFAKDSPEYYSQCVGSMKISMIARRIITRQMCYDNKALESVLWKGVDRIKIASLDAAYGGDRCMFGWGEFGLDINDNQVLCLYEPEVVPIIVGKEDPEDQIARFVKHRCQDRNIDPSNFFHDSTGRGTLGTVLGRHWSTACNPVEFGGKPTSRPVSLDFYITDEETGQRRLKLSSEHYYNFVTELWFAVRYTIESKQLRNLSKEVMDEGSKREWDYVPRGGSKVIQAEPKEEMKLRTRQSPDMFDCLVILVEGARRRGFQISRLAKESQEDSETNWLDEQSQEEDKILRNALLTH